MTSGFVVTGLQRRDTVGKERFRGFEGRAAMFLVGVGQILWWNFGVVSFSLQCKSESGSGLDSGCWSLQENYNNTLDCYDGMLESFLTEWPKLADYGDNVKKMEHEEDDESNKKSIWHPHSNLRIGRPFGTASQSPES